MTAERDPDCGGRFLIVLVERVEALAFKLREGKCASERAGSRLVRERVGGYVAIELVSEVEGVSACDLPPGNWARASRSTV